MVAQHHDIDRRLNWIRHVEPYRTQNAEWDKDLLNLELADLSMGDIRPGSRDSADFIKNFAHSAKTLSLDVPVESDMAERILFATNGQIGRSVQFGKLILADAVTRKRTELTLTRAEAVYRKSAKCFGMTPFDAAPWESVQRELRAIGWGQ